MRKNSTSDELIRLRSQAHFGNDYKFLGRSPDRPNYGIFECLLHHQAFQQILSSHFRGCRPLECSGCKQLSIDATNIGPKPSRPRHLHHHAISDEEVRLGCKEKFGDRLEFIERDPEDFRFGLFRCKHGIVSRYWVYNNRRGKLPAGCIECRRELRKSKQESDEKIRERSFAQFEGKVYFLERDFSDPSFGRFICHEHGIKFTQKLNKHFIGQCSCSLCKTGESKLSKKVYEKLKTLFKTEEIIKEKKFTDCRNHYQLPFDFYIPKLNLVIEADGEPHFKEVKSWGGSEGLMARQKNDRIKNKYMQSKKINFLRIPYYEIDNVSEVIDSAISAIKEEIHYFKIHDFQIPNS